MPWLETSPMSEREHFFTLWEQQSHTMSELCRLFNISRKTGYKWVARGKEEQPDKFGDRSRKPRHSPNQVDAKIEQLVIQARSKHPCWGARKLKRYLENQGYKGIPAASTVTAILRRNDLLSNEKRSRNSFIRFEHEKPNDLWQMDFKGHFETTRNRCYPLTVLDDHSRYSIVLKALDCEKEKSTKKALIEGFERYGIPDRMTMDNGNPWGNRRGGGYSSFTIWLMELDIGVSHSRPYHPQTQGKDERFHRTLKTEVIEGVPYKSLSDCQRAFDSWREIYNYERPHEALEMQVPASKYKVSRREYVGNVTEFEYEKDDVIRKVDASGKISFQNYKLFVGQAFHGKRVAVRRTIKDQNIRIYYRRQHLHKIDLSVQKKAKRYCTI